MTGKEAAQSAKNGGHWLIGQSAILFAIGGFAAVGLAKLFEQLPPGTDVVGLAVGIAGLVAKFSEASQKKNVNQSVTQASPVIANLVVQGLKSEIDQGAADHDACMGHHKETKEAVARLQGDVSQIAGVVGELKPGWRLGS